MKTSYKYRKKYKKITSAVEHYLTSLETSAHTVIPRLSPDPCTRVFFQKISSLLHLLPYRLTKIKAQCL